jgi:hypothetical protein
MPKEYAVGFDDGNFGAKLGLYDGDNARFKTMPSISAEGDSNYKAMKNALSGENETRDQGSKEAWRSLLMNRSHLDTADHVFSYNGEPEEFVGFLGWRQRRNSTTGIGNVNRYGTHRSRALLLTLSALLIDDEQYKLTVVTGLPMETYIQAGLTEKVKDGLKGLHRFVLDGRSRTADVRVSKVLPEGAGASLALSLPAGQSCGILDIGQFTTDCYGFDGVEPIMYLCGGKQIGIYNAYERLDVLFFRTYKRHLTPLEQIQILQARISPERRYPELTSPAGKVSVQQLDTWAFQSLDRNAIDIQDFVSSLWRDERGGKYIGAGLNRIQIIGGGTHYHSERMRSFLEIEGTERRVFASEDPEFDNVRGYGWFAQQLMNRRPATQKNESVA